MDENDAEGRKYKELWEITKAENATHTEGPVREVEGWSVVEAQGSVLKSSVRDN